MDLGATTWPALLGLATTLGLRHGYDADHLTVIDGLVRRNVRERPGLARAAGLLFSLGHGLVVTIVACAALLAARRWQLSSWVETGAAISTVIVLVVLAVLNIRSLLIGPRGAGVAPAGLRSRPFRRMLASDRPWTLGGIGMVFAISPDSLAIAAALGLAGAPLGGLGGALLAAGSFTLGMILASGTNGYCVARMVLASDRHGVLAARIMTAAVALTSIAVAASILTDLVSPQSGAANFIDGRWGGAIVIAVLISAFALSLLAARAPLGRVRPIGSPLRAATLPSEI